MAITSTNDFGRFKTNKAEDLDENAVHGLDRVDRPASDVEHAEGFGLSGNEIDPEAEAKRLALIENTVGGEYVDPPTYFEARDPNEDAPEDLDAYGKGNPPRHDRHADENSPFPTPERVVPSTPTNANPTFADYEVPTTDAPGSAKEAALDDNLVYAKPDIPLAGEGSWVVRDPQEEATGASSPIGDEHNDPTGERGADTYEEAKDIAAEHGGTIKDFGQGPIEKAGEGAEPPGVEPDPPLIVSEDSDGEIEMVQAPSESGPESEPAPDDTEDSEDDEPAGPPPKSALKADWIEYVLATYETDLETVSAMTKDEIIATYGE